MKTNLLNRFVKSRCWVMKFNRASSNRILIVWDRFRFSTAGKFKISQTYFRHVCLLRKMGSLIFWQDQVPRNSFPMSDDACQAFKNLEGELKRATQNSIDETLPCATLQGNNFRLIETRRTTSCVHVACFARWRTVIPCGWKRRNSNKLIRTKMERFSTS